MTPSYSDRYKTTYPHGFRAGQPITKRYQECRIMHPFQQALVTPQRYLSRTDTFRSNLATQPAPETEAPIWANRIMTDEGNACLIKAYDKLRSSISRAELGVGIAEAREAIGMVNHRCVQLAQAAVALRKGQFRKLEAIFRKAPTRSPKSPRLKALAGNWRVDEGVRFPSQKKIAAKWSVEKSISSIWLEFWMGWAPLVGDIFNCLEVATGEMPPFLVRGTSGYQTTYQGREGQGWIRTWDMDAFVRVGLRADVYIVNPNLALLNQFGLANPASIALAIIPFSFVLEWFVNLQQVLNTWTDFLGFELRNQQTTWKYGARGTASLVGYGNPYYDGEASRVVFTREMVLATPKLGFRRVSGLSVTRGATAMALLVSIFAP